MSPQETFNTLPRLVKSIAVAAALTLPSAMALSESMDVVQVRSDQSIDRPGRESVHAPLGTLVATPVTDPQVYGRAGGYVAADRVTVLETGITQPSDNVKTGESQTGHVAQVHTYEGVSALSPSR